jgi:hypothetical protein
MEFWQHIAVPGHLLLKNCVEDEPARPAIERALKDDSLLWLDLADNRLGSLWAFIGLCLGTEVAAVLGLLFMFRRRGWMQTRFVPNGTWCVRPGPPHARPEGSR